MTIQALGKSRRRSPSRPSPKRTAATCPASATASRPRRLPGALPIGRNSPQQCAYGLYAEQLSRLAVHRAAHHQRALLALSHPPDRDPWGQFQKADIGLWRTAPARRGRGADRAHALGSDPAAGRRRSRFSKASAPSPRRAMPARRPAWARMSISSPARWRTSTSTMPTANCCSCRSRARLRFWTEFGIIDIEPGEIAVIPRGVKFRVELHGRAGARLCLRELWRRLHPARARADRRQLPGQSARLPDAGRRLRGQGRALARCT